MKRSSESKVPFTDHHLMAVMQRYSEVKLPLDIVLSDYFRSNRALGAKDRRTIGDSAYQLIRWRGLYEYLAGKSGDWEACFSLLKEKSPEECVNDETIPLHCRTSMPESLFQKLCNQYGGKAAFELALLFNERAPLTIRVNRLKCDRNALMERWRGKLQMKASPLTPSAITLLQKVNCLTLPEYKEGLFEIQDEGSQMAAELVDIAPGEKLLDYCAGGGGKSLAIAPKMEGKGQLYLHDIRKHALSEAKKRLKRAGVENAQIIAENSPLLKKLKKKMEWVVADVPCSGSGTYRRNPDMKWLFTEETLPRLTGEQRTIFEKALSFVKEGGKIAYMTCSILPEENERQVDHFLEKYPLELLREPLALLPVSGGHDGFFAALFKRR